jgi:hypothetical protein
MAMAMARARELGWRWPAEVRAIKGGAGRRGGRSRQGGWGAGSGSPWPPARRAERHSRGEERRKAGGGRVPASRQAERTQPLRPRGTRRVRGRRAGSAGGLGRPLRGGSRAPHSAIAGTAGEPQPPPASAPATCAAARPSAPRPVPPRRARPGGQVRPGRGGLGPGLTSAVVAAPPNPARDVPAGRRRPCCGAEKQSEARPRRVHREARSSGCGIRGGHASGRLEKHCKGCVAA